ncbi:hypothetical protein EAKF1_ch0001c [Escherichia albertii KF1]|nr:hypothetical protein EAKF1_ch0001c [Escherichia albertii KF1]
MYITSVLIGECISPITQRRRIHLIKKGISAAYQTGNGLVERGR